jgi:hypothetical protein
VKTSRRNLADMPVPLTSPRAIGSLVIVKTIAAALRVKRIEAFETDRGSVIPVGTSTDRRSLERTHGGDSRRAIEHPWDELFDLRALQLSFLQIQCRIRRSG